MWRKTAESRALIGWICLLINTSVNYLPRFPLFSFNYQKCLQVDIWRENPLSLSVSNELLAKRGGAGVSECREKREKSGENGGQSWRRNLRGKVRSLKVLTARERSWEKSFYGALVLWLWPGLYQQTTTITQTLRTSRCFRRFLGRKKAQKCTLVDKTEKRVLELF